MADQSEFKIKGAAEKKLAESPVQPSTPEAARVAEDVPPTSTSLEEGEITPTSTNGEATASVDVGQTTDESNKKAELIAMYPWCKCFCDPAEYAKDHYYVNMDTKESTFEEPYEPYWVYDVTTGKLDGSGIPGATSTASKQTSSTEVVPAKQTSSTDVDPNYQGYNPKIHGNYDPNAPYAQYHNKKREEEAKAQQMAQGTYAPSNTAYVASGTFNRFTGHFQDPSKSAERHNDYNKSGRQMNAFFDVDAAANLHDGRSLKEERRNQPLTKQQIRELAKHRKEKKLKKRMDFYKS